MQFMAFIFEGNSAVGADVRSNLCYLICLRHLNKSRAVTTQKNIFSFKLVQHALCYHNIILPSIISTMLICVYYSMLCLPDGHNGNGGAASDGGADPQAEQQAVQRGREPKLNSLVYIHHYLYLC